eukprot:sb/3474586/
MITHQIIRVKQVKQNRKTCTSRRLTPFLRRLEWKCTVGPRFTGPRYTGTPIYREIKFPQYRKLMVFDPDIPGTPIYRAKPFPPRIPVNRGPTRSFPANQLFAIRFLSPFSILSYNFFPARVNAFGIHPDAFCKKA